MKWNNKSITEIHNALVKKEVTPTELVKECIEESKKDKCNSLEATCFEEALSNAEKIKEVKDNEILKGIPFYAKDNFSTKGVETTASSNILNGYVPIYNATVIDKLKKAGMILMGKTTMDELAMGGTGLSSHKGISTNPYDHERIIGGSSCGSAGVVAQGFVPFALGSDTGDSVRKPASYNSLVGYKPSWGRVSRYGLFAFATSLDTVAYFTRNVLDASYILSAIDGHDKKDMSSSYRTKEKYYEYIKKEKKLKKIGYFRYVYENITNKDIKVAFDKLVDNLMKNGYIVEEYDYPKELLDALYPTYMIISCAEATSNNACLDGIKYGQGVSDASSWVEYMTKARTKGFSSLIKRRFVIGSYSLLEENQKDIFIKAQKARHLIVNELNKFFDIFDYLLVPASYSEPKKISEIETRWSSKPDFLDNILTLGNFGGNPSITLPLTTTNKMPVGVNVTGRTFEDGYVFSLANDIEKITNIHDKVKE